MPPMIGPKIQPTPLHDCARLMRVAAYLGSPSTVVYGLAIVSRKVRPLAITHTPTRYAQNCAICVAGMNQDPPAATISSPVIMPPLYPNLLASIPAGIDIRK